MKKIHKKGFTLIELLVVVAIIGILATVVLSNLNQARERAQNTKFVANIDGLKKGMELYYLDNGRYPVIDTLGLNPQIYTNRQVTTIGQDLIDELEGYFSLATFFEQVPEYISSFQYRNTVGGICYVGVDASKHSSQGYGFGFVTTISQTYRTFPPYPTETGFGSQAGSGTVNCIPSL